MARSSDHAEVNFAGDVGRLLHQHLGDLLALLAGLLGDERILEHHLGDLADVVAFRDELDAAEVLAAVLEAALAAAAGVNLGLEHDRAAAELVERLPAPRPAMQRRCRAGRPPRPPPAVLSPDIRGFSSPLILKPRLSGIHSVISVRSAGAARTRKRASIRLQIGPVPGKRAAAPAVLGIRLILVCAMRRTPSEHNFLIYEPLRTDIIFASVWHPDCLNPCQRCGHTEPFARRNPLLRRFTSPLAVVLLVVCASPCFADDPTPPPTIDSGDTAWMLTSSALVMLMVPGLALFYGGMVRRKNVLATMMHSMVALAVVGVYWMAIGYSLAFGDPWLHTCGRQLPRLEPELVFLQGVGPDDAPAGHEHPGLPAHAVPGHVRHHHAGPDQRGRGRAHPLQAVLPVPDPLGRRSSTARWPTGSGPWTGTGRITWKRAKPGCSGTKPVGWLGAMGALDFAGGTVVHIAAGFSGLAAILVLRKRLGYPEHAMHPNSMVLTLTGAGLLWFGWFGFNGGSALASGTLATSAFAATQAAAAAAGLSWMLAEWLHNGKPTALGLASGIVAGLVAVTPGLRLRLPCGRPGDRPDRRRRLLRRRSASSRSSATTIRSTPSAFTASAASWARS